MHSLQGHGYISNFILYLLALASLFQSHSSPCDSSSAPSTLCPKGIYSRFSLWQALSPRSPHCFFPHFTHISIRRHLLRPFFTMLRNIPVILSVLPPCHCLTLHIYLYLYLLLLLPLEWKPREDKRVYFIQHYAPPCLHRVRAP